MTSLFPSIRFGGDYNPDQWPSELVDEDVVLMNRAGVTSATVAVFSWARIEPRPGEFDFAWLDEVFEKLHAGGIRVILATATASPPAWLAKQFPDSLPVDANGVRLGFGSRQQYSPSSSAYLEHALRLVEKMAERYGSHPALEAWHTNNEYGCHVSHSYDPESAAAFRVWLEKRYGDIAALNEAWGTSFWSQRYDSFDEVDPPAAAPTIKNPTQLLDFDRFSSDALLALHRAEVEVLRRVSPGIPITTNFMGFFKNADYWQWAEHVDFVSDDSYPDPADADAYVALAASRDLMRSLGGGKPWLLMEQSTSAVNWRPQNAPKPAGLNRVQSLQAVARGADGILYFQWRQAKAGAEKFHASMVPHIGAESRIFREVSELGAELAELDRALGESVSARIAILFDWDAWRALEQYAVPRNLSYVQTVLSWYRPLLESGVTVDFVRAASDYSAYDVLIVPALVAASDDALDAIDAFAVAGGRVVVGYQSAVLDESLHVRLGGYLGLLQDTLGLRIEEFAPLAPVGVPQGSPLEAFMAPAGATPRTAIDGEFTGAADLWQEIVLPGTAEVVSRFSDGFAAGHPAITRNDRGDGVAWYVATQPEPTLLAAILETVLADAGIVAPIATPAPGVEAVRRGEVTFLINHGPTPATIVFEGEEITIPLRDVIIR